MVETFIVSKLDTIQELNNQFYPAAAPVGECSPPFSIYSVLESVQTNDLSGNVAYYTDTIRVHFLGDDNDVLRSLVESAEKLLSVQCEEWEEFYIFSSSVRGEPDGFDMNMSMFRKTVLVTVLYWSELCQEI